MEQPHKFVNHEVANTLDSSNAFEGPEKLLELWFEPPKGESKGLLDVPRKVWEAMLDLVHCKVLSILSYTNVDAYVLSESSLFVYSDHLVLKTCGTTTLLEGVPSILSIVKEHTALNPECSRVFYSRRSFLFPDKQIGPHRSWSEEVKALKEHFPLGQSIACGPSKAERWHLFMYSNNTASTPAKPSLEMMMTGLDTTACDLFFTGRCMQPTTLTPGSSPSDSPHNPMEDSVMSLASSVGAEPDDDDPGHQLGNIMTRISNIDEVYPTMNQTVDSFAFSPCGYSCNGIVDGDNFFTIHVTPENGYSYASFGTNVPPEPYKLTHVGVIDRILSIFNPDRFELALFEGPENGLPEEVPGYACTSELLHDTDSSSMWYKSFRRVR